MKFRDIKPILCTNKLREYRLKNVYTIKSLPYPREGIRIVAVVLGI
jgi:hypothetical protein